jgi:glycosyltransferase involved in cell wall biosynthesis
VSATTVAARKQEGCAEGGPIAAVHPKVPLSILIPTRNEQENIAKCLESVSWADEVYVVDSNSKDRTAQIAGTMGAHVVNFSWNGRGLRKYNWALRNIPWKHEWLLIVDADEEVSPELRVELARTVQESTPHAGFLVRFHYYFLGRLVRHGDPLWKLILFRHRLARIEVRDVPEINSQMDVELHSYPILQGTVGRLRHAMIHRDLADLHHHFERHNTYSDGEALLRARYRDRSLERSAAPAAGHTRGAAPLPETTLPAASGQALGLLFLFLRAARSLLGRARGVYLQRAEILLLVSDRH